MAIDFGADVTTWRGMVITESRHVHMRRQVGVGTLSLGIAFGLVMAMLGLHGHAPSRPGRTAVTMASEPLRPSPVRPVPAPPPPMALVDLPLSAALASNAAWPFSSEPIVPARAFVYAGAPEDRARASTCLAAAVLYEAGDDPAGERAVAQVVVNRLRHPAFPKTVCGVVFQGSDLPTGCQFTFTCDGALARLPQPRAWQHAKEIAEAALSGKVDPTVGTATHYHTDWVVPYWRDTLVKLAKVHTQIFYRMTGWWGTRAALTGTVQPAEPLAPAIEARLRGEPQPALTQLVLTGTEPAAPARQDEHDPGLAVPGVPPASLRGAVVRAMDRTNAEFVLQLDPTAYPGSYALVSIALCGTADRCRVMGWMADTRVPTSLPVPPDTLRSAAFVYTRLRAHGIESALWDCRRVKRDYSTQCLPQGSAALEQDGNRG